MTTYERKIVRQLIHEMSSSFIRDRIEEEEQGNHLYPELSEKDQKWFLAQLKSELNRKY